jgi:CRP/FNR family transcriptional regulator
LESLVSPAHHYLNNSENLLMNKLEILKKLSFYNNASSALKAEIEKISTHASLDEDKILFLEGDACHNIGFVGIGNIRVSKVGETGREITLYHVQPGEGCVLNISCAFSEIGYPATATIESHTEMVIFPSSVFRDWMSKQEIRGFVFQLFSRRLTQVITLLEEVIFRKMDQRLAEFLISRFDNQGKPRRTFHMTQEQIAVELGTAREVVNRLLKEFERQGAIESSRGILKLLNENILKQFHSSAH